MRVTRLVTVLSTVALVGLACSDDATGIPAGVEIFTATLNGANERPTPVTTTATGTAVVTVLGNLVSWKVDVVNIDSIVAGHIHHGPVDSAGGVRVNFVPAVTGQNFTGTATVGSATVADSILVFMRAGNSYVNIHTAVNGGGEIRGQLRKL
jgi:hypothetical protein